MELSEAELWDEGLHEAAENHVQDHDEDGHSALEGRGVTRPEDGEAPDSSDEEPPSKQQANGGTANGHAANSLRQGSHRGWSPAQRMPLLRRTGDMAHSAARSALEGSSQKLASSMPIQIPLLSRLTTAAAKGEEDDSPATIVPPHLLVRQISMTKAGAEQSLGLGLGTSPSASLKRDRLMQRNAILRRTGFIENGSVTHPPSLIDTLDPIKESHLESRSARGFVAGVSPEGLSVPRGRNSLDLQSGALSKAFGTTPPVYT